MTARTMWVLKAEALLISNVNFKQFFETI